MNNKNDWTNKVIFLKNLHKKTWRNKSEWFWFFALSEEIVELLLSLIGLHKHSPDSELMQIAAICINWLEMRNENK